MNHRYISRVWDDDRSYTIGPAPTPHSTMINYLPGDNSRTLAENKLESSNVIGYTRRFTTRKEGGGGISITKKKKCWEGCGNRNFARICENRIICAIYAEIMYIEALYEGKLYRVQKYSLISCQVIKKN